MSTSFGDLLSQHLAQNRHLRRGRRYVLDASLLVLSQCSGCRVPRTTSRLQAINDRESFLWPLLYLSSPTVVRIISRTIGPLPCGAQGRQHSPGVVKYRRRGQGKWKRVWVRCALHVVLHLPPSGMADTERRSMESLRSTSAASCIALDFATSMQPNPVPGRCLHVYYP